MDKFLVLVDDGTDGGRIGDANLFEFPKAKDGRYLILDYGIDPSHKECGQCWVKIIDYHDGNKEKLYTGIDLFKVEGTIENDSIPKKGSGYDL